MDRTFRDRLLQGRTMLGFNVMHPAPGIVEEVGGLFDWIWIDGQHGQHDYQSMMHITRTCDFMGCASFVRVPGHEAGPIGLMLDLAPNGVIVPCVDTPQQARDLVRAAKFPPLGNRSFGGRRPCDLFGRQYAYDPPEHIMLICQIESPQAIDNADEIASIEGVDGLFLGPDDIMLRRAFPATQPRSREALGPDMQVVMDACRKHGKIGVISAGSTPMVELAHEFGFQMIMATGDIRVIRDGATAAAQAARKIVGK